MDPANASGRSPGSKLVVIILVAMLLAVPLFTVWLLVYDRESQSQAALTSIAEGWAGPQTVSGPLLVIPYRAEIEESVEENGRTVRRARVGLRELVLAPAALALETDIAPERRSRSIYEAVVYRARLSGRARFALPADLERYGVAREALLLDRAELRFGLSDMRGIERASLSASGAALALRSGGGQDGARFQGVSAFVDASSLAARAMPVAFEFAFRGNQSLALRPWAGVTSWRLRSPWPHPSFQGGFLPSSHAISVDGFAAEYRISNLALGRSLVDTSDDFARLIDPDGDAAHAMIADPATAAISLIDPVDIYSRVDRSVKYGFLIIGFTFLAYLMFDVIAGVRVSAVEYLLVGAALVLFFVMLLAFAEIVGFALAFLIAGGAIVGLNTAYSAAVLGRWRRAGMIGGLLAALYAVLFVLLSLESYSLLIGSLLLFAALAGVMYLTRNLDWGARLEASTG